MAEWTWRAGWWSVLLLCTLASSARAESLATELVADAADGELDERSFLSAALIASGVSDRCELMDWQARYDALRLDFTFTPTSGTLNARLGAVHKLLHERLLIGQYVAAASDLRITLSRGDYNCLSALAIHYDLCARAGLALEIWAEPGHVSLRLGDGLEIEPGSLGPSARLLARAQPSRRLTPVELLGKFYYNRGVEHLRSRQYAAGLDLLKTSLQLDPADRDARENLLAGMNNWAVEHCRTRRYDLAAPLIAQGLNIEPTFAPLVANERLLNGQDRPK